MATFLRLFACLMSVSMAYAESKPTFRTDADGPLDPKAVKLAKDKGEPPPPEWFALVEGEFPPAGSAHAISGELMKVEHLERRFQLRVDRNDSQDRGFWDLPVDAAMLPYGSIFYHGAPAALQDIPLGTHLHGLFYLKHPDDDTPLPDGPNNRQTPESEFRRCFRLEDDFTYRARQNQTWKIDSVDLDTKKLTATLHDNGKAVGDPAVFDLLASTQVYQENGFGEMNSIQPGQDVLLNLTWATLYGPGRVLEIWLDETSREQAVARQLERHRDHVRERGLPGWVSAVDDENQIVTLTFFGNVDPALFDDLRLVDGKDVGWPLAKEADKPGAPKGTIAVARDSLMTYDPVNDRKGGNIVDFKKIPIEPGSTGIQIRVKCDLQLEGFRPRRIVRFYPATWPVIALPREEQFFGSE